MRKNKRKTSKLTLFHQKSTAGLRPNQIFDRFSYEEPFLRDGSLKRKLFTTIHGNKVNNLCFILRGNGDANVDLYFQDVVMDLCIGQPALDFRKKTPLKSEEQDT